MKYLIKKLITLIITLLLVSAAAFTAFELIPGDSVTASLGTDYTEEAAEQLREELGLNRSLPERFFSWLWGAIRGDFGTSLQYRQPVSDLIAERLSVTMWLAVLSMVFVVVISIPLGILAARFRGGIADRVITLISQAAMAIPPFFLGILLTLVFGILLSWFTPGAYVSIEQDPAGFFAYLIFPAVSVAIPKIAMTVKFLRSSVIRQMRLDYVRTARSKGNKESAVLIRHVLKNALIPVVTFLGMAAADVLAGSFIVEQVFGLPGIGRLLVVSISDWDYAVVQAIILYIAFAVVVINFLVDLLYQQLDPRVRLN